MGAVIPLFSAWRTVTQGSADPRAEAWILVFSATAYLFAAAVLHWGARRQLRDLKE